MRSASPKCTRGITTKPTSAEIAARLITRESTSTSESHAAAAAAGAIGRMCTSLNRFIGADGCRALLVRALANARADQPALEHITIGKAPEMSLQGVPESMDAPGAAEIASGLEALVVSLIELLHRLVGDELAMKLLEPNPADAESSDSSRQ